MESHLCLPTRHFPAMRHHKTVLVHSSVRLPALQAKVGPPPGAARVAVVGAGVVLACALGTMYWKRARALQLPMHCSSQPSHGGNGSAGDDPASGIVSSEELHFLLSKISIRKIDPKPPLLTERILQWLAQKDVKNISKNQDLTSLLEENLPKTNVGKDDYNLAIVLILALIYEKKYVKAKEILNQLPIQSESDRRPDLLLAVINMMMAMESMLQFPDKTSTQDLKEPLEQVENAWKNGGAGDHPASGIVPIEKLHDDLMSEICIRNQLTKLIHQCLAQKDLHPDLMTSFMLDGNFPTTNIGHHEYNLGIVLILALINEKKYAKAKEICNKLIPIASLTDATPDLLLATINMMMAMERMLQFTLDLEQQLGQVEKAWEDYKSKAVLEARPDVQP